ncbi:hypothetical protein GCM10027605_47470 [Micromonospora zhanjiangensis]
MHLAAQPRLDTLVTGFAAGPGSDELRRVRTEYAGVAWIGDQPDPDTGMLGSTYRRRAFDARLFLPDTHWYDADALADAEVQVTGALLQVPKTDRDTQGLVGAAAEPVVEFYEHPEGQPGVGVCLWLRGDLWSNLGLSYRIIVLCAAEAIIRPGADTDSDTVFELLPPPDGYGDTGADTSYN